MNETDFRQILEFLGIEQPSCADADFRKKQKKWLGGVSDVAALEEEAYKSRPFIRRHFVGLLPLEQKPEPRMKETMNQACQAIKASWHEPRTAHPFANLDGAISCSGKQLAVVELEAKIPKQVRGALLDLLGYPGEERRILVIGIGGAEDAENPMKTKRGIQQKVLPTLERLLGVRLPDVGIFTEAELRREPNRLARFLDLSLTD